MGRLDGKVALVFGGGPNIGGTIGHFFAREGARVAITDVVSAAADETAQFLIQRGYTAMALCGDSTKEEDVAAIVGRTVEAFGHVDAMVNLSGAVVWRELTEMESAEWNKCVMSFLSAGFLTTKYTARAMLKQHTRGCIINILSTAAHFGEAAGTAYCAAKAGLLNFSRAAAMDLAYAGIRVNTITPCSMEHQLWTKMRHEVTQAPPPRTRSFYSRDDYLKEVPLGRFARASDIAGAAVYLASDEAEFVTGVDIPVDGGLRFKYPTWRPGDFTGANIEEYLRTLKVTRYGEPVADFKEIFGSR